MYRAAGRVSLRVGPACPYMGYKARTLSLKIVKHDAALSTVLLIPELALIAISNLVRHLSKQGESQLSSITRRVLVTERITT